MKITEKESFNDRVYEVVRKIPCGKVLNYGTVAHLAGNARAARAVGYACAAINAPQDLPYHRVLFKDGSLSDAFLVNGKNMQYALLKKEKISFTKDKKVKMSKHLWHAKTLELEAFLKHG
ncbi:methylated-DNA-protein-cysteine methyltransferase related protein [Parelusimicrobium proximum]|uniref:MGMT family protein n=1 Tax=Parelusimicrobium proximum TaxID=3228953 RepID=UPI003D17E13C